MATKLVKSDDWNYLKDFSIYLSIEFAGMKGVVDLGF